MPPPICWHWSAVRSPRGRVPTVCASLLGNRENTNVRRVKVVVSLGTLDKTIEEPSWSEVARAVARSSRRRRAMPRFGEQGCGRGRIEGHGRVMPSILLFADNAALGFDLSCLAHTQVAILSRDPGASCRDHRRGQPITSAANRERGRCVALGTWGYWPFIAGPWRNGSVTGSNPVGRGSSPRGPASAGEAPGRAARKPAGMCLTRFDFSPQHPDMEVSDAERSDDTHRQPAPA
jgi:hypothetical protein